MKRLNRRHVEKLIKKSQKDYIDLSFCIIEGMDLRELNIQNTLFRNTNLIKCNLEGADFSNSILENVWFNKVVLKSSNFSNTFISYCDFNEVNFKSTKFNEAELENCNFIEVDISEVDFSDCILSFVVFHNAIAKGAILRNIKLESTDISNLLFDKKTILEGIKKEREIL